MADRFHVEVCYARPEAAEVIEIEIVEGTTARQAVEQSGLLDRCPGLDLSRCGLGSFGRPIKAGDRLRPGDRLEVYRPLPNDPKEMRRRAARER